MQIIPDSERVRVYEHDPAMPSGALPMFGGYHDRIGKKAATQTALDLLFVLGGIGLIATGSGLAGPVTLIVMFGGFAAFWTYFRARYVPAKHLKRVSFRRVDIGADELVAAGKTVGVRLPDGRWLHFRPAEAWRMVLAVRRRLWLLGDGDRAFVGFPGALQVLRSRIRDEPPSGAVVLPPVVRQPTSPRLDPVLNAYRRQTGRAFRYIAAFFLGLAGLLMWVGLDASRDSSIPRFFAPAAIVVVSMTVTMVIFLAALAAVHAKPLPADSWTELRAVLAGPVQLVGGMFARLDGRAMLADGREVTFRLPKVDVSLAADIAATGQLWIVGVPRLNKTLKAGVPGYPLLGRVRLS